MRADGPHKVEDEFWNFTYSAPALRKLLDPGEPALLFKGRCAGGVFVLIRVHESTQEEDAATWRARRREELGLKAGEATEADDPVRLVYTRRKYGVYDEVRAHAFFPRGLLCFEAEAWVPDRSGTSDADLLAALRGLRPGPDKGCGLRVRREALRTGRPPTDPAVLAEAGRQYLDENPALAAAVLARARKLLKPKQMERADEARLLFYGGLAYLRTGQFADAARWLAEAEKKATGEAAREAAYHRARAASAAGDLDQAFVALDRAFAEGLVVSKARLSKEKELENARKDPRWEDFWAKSVGGRR